MTVTVYLAFDPEHDITAASEIKHWDALPQEARDEIIAAFGQQVRAVAAKLSRMAGVTLDVLLADDLDPWSRYTLADHVARNDSTDDARDWWQKIHDHIGIDDQPHAVTIGVNPALDIDDITVAKPTPITLDDAIDRLIDADQAGVSRIYHDDGSVCDGDPYTIPEEGRVHIAPAGLVTIDIPDHNDDGFVTIDLGNAFEVRDALKKRGAIVDPFWIDVIMRQPVHVDLLEPVLNADEDDIQALIDQLIELEDSDDPTMVDDQHISPTAALHIYRQLNS